MLPRTLWEATEAEDKCKGLYSLAEQAACVPNSAWTEEFIHVGPREDCGIGRVVSKLMLFHFAEESIVASRWYLLHHFHTLLGMAFVRSRKFFNCLFSSLIPSAANFYESDGKDQIFHDLFQSLLADPN